MVGKHDKHLPQIMVNDGDDIPWDRIRKRNHQPKKQKKNTPTFQGTITYPTWGKGKSSTQKWLLPEGICDRSQGGYVSLGKICLLWNLPQLQDQETCWWPPSPPGPPLVAPWVWCEACWGGGEQFGDLITKMKAVGIISIDHILD